MLLTPFYYRSGLGFMTIFFPHGDRWRLHRRLFHQTFRPDAVHGFLPSQHRKACQFLRRLIDAPEQFDNHIFEWVLQICWETKLIYPSRYTAVIIINSTYNYDPVSRKDELLVIVENVLNIAVPAMRPDVAVMLGAFPWCESIAFPISSHSYVW